jgi:hypothetical protein
MIAEIVCQEQYSRGELLLRSFLGIFYIYLPHAFILMFVQLWAGILLFLTFWVILFTGRYPESWFEFQVKAMRWSWRVNARYFNLCDGYPAFGLDAEDDYTTFEVSYPEHVSRGLVLVRFLFGVFYVLLPHGLILGIRTYVSLFLAFVAFWAVLITARYPDFVHEFNTGTLRWAARVNLYMSYMTDRYPPFSGKADSEFVSIPKPGVV